LISFDFRSGASVKMARPIGESREEEEEEVVVVNEMRRGGGEGGGGARWRRRRRGGGGAFIAIGNWRHPRDMSTVFLLKGLSKGAGGAERTEARGGEEKGEEGGGGGGALFAIRDTQAYAN